MPVIAVVTLIIHLFRYIIDYYRKRERILSQSSERVFSRLNALPQQSICENYFSALYNLNKDWTINSFNDDENPSLSKKHTTDSIRHLGVYGKMFHHGTKLI